jgi:glutamate/aspartate transport system substrate-binding protein
MFKQIRIACLSLVSITTLFIGAAQAQSTLEKVKSSGAITLAYRESSVPFSYLGENGQPVGFGFEICKHWKRTTTND